MSTSKPQTIAGQHEDEMVIPPTCVTQERRRSTELVFTVRTSARAIDDLIVVGLAGVFEDLVRRAIVQCMEVRAHAYIDEAERRRPAAERRTAALAE